MDPLIGWMLQQAGLDQRAYRPSAMERRVPACLRQLRVTSAEAARLLLQRRPELMPFALSTILIGVSDFFRDTPVFDQLRDTVLPTLLRAKASLRVCSAGASDGHELYSVGMLLAEQNALAQAELLGMDCRRDAMMRAAAGQFGPEDLTGVTPGRRARFFQPENGRWRIRPELRRQTRWEVANLFTFHAPGPWDLVLFRNVAIYLDEAHAALAWERLVSQLAPGGYLISGKAEKPPASLPLCRVAPSVYQKHPA